MLSNSLCNHTLDYQMGLLLHGHPILLITRMITDQKQKQQQQQMELIYNTMLLHLCFC